MNNFKDYQVPSVLEELSGLSVSLMCHYQLSGPVEITFPAKVFEQFIYDTFETGPDQGEVERQRLAREQTEVNINLPHGQIKVKKGP